jgi:hypothetical protein
MSDNLHILSLSAYTTPTIQESKKDNWVEYGEDNNYYSFLIDRYTNSTTNSAIINNIARLVYGKGLSALDANRKPAEYAQMMALFSKDDIRKIIIVDIPALLIVKIINTKQTTHFFKFIPRADVGIYFSYGCT